MKLSQTLAIALESVGCSVVIAGIVIEYITQADCGYLIITSGSLLIAGGGLIWVKLARLGK